MPVARDFLVRGLLAGLVAGVVAFAVAYVVGEPPLNAAIALEQAGATEQTGETGHSPAGTGEPGHADAGSGQAHANEHAATAEVPRFVQSTVGLLTGTTVLGATLGGLVGVLSALAMGRFGRLGPRATTLLVTAVGFVAVVVVPFAGYPPNPPAVGRADTIGDRTALYGVLLAISLIAAVTSVLVARRAAARIGAWYAGLAAGAGYLVVAVTAIAVMPGYDEVADGFPASLLYAFRGASLLTQIALWGTLGVVLAELVHRLTQAAADRGSVADQQTSQPVEAGR